MRKPRLLRQIGGIALAIEDFEGPLSEPLRGIRSALADVSDSVFVKDLDGTYIWVNEACAKRFEATVDEVIGRRANDFLDAETSRRIAAAEDWVYRREEPLEAEESIPFPRGACTFLVTRSPIRDESGKMIGMIGIARDVSQRQLLNEALATSEANLRAAQQQARLGSWSMGPDDDRMSWSDEMFRLFDLDPDQDAPTPEEFLELVHPDDRTELIACFQTLFEPDPPRRHAFRSNPEFGPVRYFDARNDRQTDANGRVTMVFGTLLDVTERHHAEQALRRSEERFSKIFRASPIAIAYSELESGRLIDVNDQYAALFGYRREELIGASSFALFADAPSCVELSQRLREESSVHNVEVRFRRKDGEIRDALMSLESLPLDDEAVLLSMVVDITDRKRAEEAVVASESRLRTILESEPECVKVVDRKGCLVDMNPAGLSMIEADALGPMIGQPVFGLVAEEFRDRYKRLHANALAGGSGYLEFEIVGLKGRRISVETHSVPFIDNSGSIVGVLSITRNVTARMAAEQALRESEERYRHLFEANPQPMWVYDLETLGVLAVNDAALDQYGYTREEFLAMNITDFRPAEDVPELLEVVRRERSGISHSGIWRHIKKSGELFCADIRSHQIDWAGRSAIVVMATDVTARLEAEEAIRSLNVELERRVEERTVQMDAANRELEAFCYSVSHDLRTPLRAISGFASALREDYGPKLEPEANEYLGRIVSGTERMTEVINDLLRLSRVSRAEMSPTECDLSQLARQIESEMRSDGPDRNVECLIQPGLSAQVDRGLIRVALENLLQNAWKFTAKRDSARIEFGASESEEGTVFFVKDNGAGFDMAYSNKLFGVFERLHRAGEFPGTGIGLATVHRIVQRHGGRIWAEAEVDKGATFYFTLPPAVSNPN